MNFATFGPLAPARRRFFAEGEVFASVCPGHAVRVFGTIDLGAVHYIDALDRFVEDQEDLGHFARLALDAGPRSHEFLVFLDYLEESHGLHGNEWMLALRDQTGYARHMVQFDETYFLGDAVKMPCSWWTLRDPRVRAHRYRPLVPAVLVKVCWKSVKVRRVARDDAARLERETMFKFYEMAILNWRRGEAPSP